MIKRNETEKIKDIESKNEPVVYVGPSILNVVLQNTVFISGISEILEEKSKKYPVLQSLIIPVSKYSCALMEIQKGGAMAVLFEQALKIK